ncbi:MAG TPA: hypothetical protein V6C46_06205, partial [Coleofasciculaceae cyanobacterium]
MAIDSNSRLLPVNNVTAQAIPIVQELSSSSVGDEKWDLKWLASVFCQRALLMASVALSTTLVAGTMMWRDAASRPAMYTGQFQILVEAVNTEERKAQAIAKSALSDTGITADSTLDYDTQLLILKSPKLINPIVEQLKPRYPNLTYDELVGNLAVSRISTKRQNGYEDRPTKLIQATYTDPDPQKVQVILNALSEAYLRYSLKERQSSIRQGIKFIDSQLPQLQQRVNTLQKQVQALRERNTLFDPTSRGQELSSFSASLDQQRFSNQTALIEAMTRLEQLQQQLQAGNLAVVLSDGPHQGLLGQYQALEGQLAIESARLTPDNPALQALLDKRQNLQRLLQQEANQVLAKASKQIQIAATRNQNLAQTQTSVQQQLRQ